MRQLAFGAIFALVSVNGGCAYSEFTVGDNNATGGGPDFQPAATGGMNFGVGGALSTGGAPVTTGGLNSSGGETSSGGVASVGGSSNGCAPEYKTYTQSNGAYVRFHLHGGPPGTPTNGSEGDVISYVDGSFYSFMVLYCVRVTWSNVSFQCTAGKWISTPGTTPGFGGDGNCYENAPSSPDIQCGAYIAGADASTT